MFLRHLQHTLILEQRRPGASQRTVSRNMNALVLAEIDNFLLRQQWVVLDLVDGGCDGGFCEQLLDGLDFVGVRLDEFLEVLPGLDVGDAVVDVAGAVFEFGEEGVVSWSMLVYVDDVIVIVRTIRVHRNRPVHEVKVHVWCLEHVQALLQSLFCASVECAPKLACNEQLLALHDTARDDILKCFTDLIFILVAECTIDVSITTLNCMHNSLLDLTRRRLPCPQPQSGDGRASIERNSGIHVRRRVQNAIRGSFEDKFRKSGIHSDLWYM
jgi:hypothetical protein